MSPAPKHRPWRLEKLYHGSLHAWYCIANYSTQDRAERSQVLHMRQSGDGPSRYRIRKHVEFEAES